MPLPQAGQQIAADRAMRIAKHQTNIAPALMNGSLGKPDSPLNLLSDGDSWFDYPLDDDNRFGKNTDIIAQLPSFCKKPPYILNFAESGDATTTALGLPRAKRIVDALKNPANGPFDAILFSGGGDDVVGDQFCIWLNDAKSVGNDPTKALNTSRINGVLDLIQASYDDLISLRDENAPGVPIFVHAYDFAIPSGIGVYCLGPWLKPSLDYCGWTDPTQAKQIVRDALTPFGTLMNKIATNAANKNVVYVRTQGTLSPTDWANELHPKQAGFNKITALFYNALKDWFNRDV